MTRAPADVSDRLFAALREVFSEAQIAELTLAVAAYNLTNRFNLAVGTELEPRFEKLAREIRSAESERVVRR